MIMICQYQRSVHYNPPAPTDFTGTEVVRVIEIYATHCHTVNSQSRLFVAHAHMPAHFTA